MNDPISLLTGFANLVGGHPDPTAETQRSLQMLMERFGPEAIMRMIFGVYGGLKQSPMYSAAMGNLVSGAQQSGNILNRNLAAAGIANSGVGQIQRSLIPSVFANQQNALNSQTFGQAGNIVQGIIPQILQAGIGNRGIGGRENPWLGLAQGVSNTNWLPIFDMFRRHGSFGNSGPLYNAWGYGQGSMPGSGR